MEKGEKEYLGDAVYLSFDGYHFVLETSDGISTTNQIFLEPPVLDRLLQVRDEMYKRYGKKVN